jgi:TRAP-type C4-dicarboxylate transport system permease large subunit
MVVGCAIGKSDGSRVEKHSRFYIPMVIVLFLVTYIPELSLWLPRLVLN